MSRTVTLVKASDFNIEPPPTCARCDPICPRCGRQHWRGFQVTKYAYIVRYRRAGWKQRKARYYRNRDAAHRLVEKLLSPDSYLAPIVECWIERQKLGPAETIWTLEARR